jgi:hypothetical protein
MSSYKFRVLLDNEGDSDIFRDIVIGPHNDFEVLYHAIIASFGFRGDQLGSFYVSNDSWDRGHEIALMDMGLGNDLNAPFLMKDTPIANVVRGEGQKLILVYDFLKMWCFLIEMVEVLPMESEEPELFFAVGEAPDEDDREVDLGGPTGLPDLGDDIDDIFSDFDSDDDEGFGSFENIDDFDI